MLNDIYAVTDLNVLKADTYHKIQLAQSVEYPFYRARGRRFKLQWFFSVFFFFFLLLLSFLIIAKWIIKCSLLATIY